MDLITIKRAAAWLEKMSAASVVGIFRQGFYGIVWGIAGYSVSVYPSKNAREIKMEIWIAAQQSAWAYFSAAYT